MKRNNRSGIILLVVLSMLAFFSLLVAAYLVFSSQAKQTSFAIATRSIKQSDPNDLLNEALMTLVRGTGDSTDPFFGEDLLSDYYGRTDAMSLATKAAGARIGLTGFAEFTVESTTAPDLNDIFAGRLMTFRDGPALNRTYRVVRSISLSGNEHKLIIDVESDLDVTLIPTGTSVWLNGIPRNSIGFGFDGTVIGQDAVAQPNTPAAGNIGFTLPAALQPNHFLGTNVDKSTIISAAAGSDFDESYDAADFNNWFLSYRHSDGTVIPSFHRPAVLNYILNQVSDWPAASNTFFRDAIVSISRATFRPIPIASGQLWVDTSTSPATLSDPINERFTGGSNEFALRTPLLLRSGGDSRLNQVARALIDGNWDVDNDSDGTPDSIWMDLGLPVVRSPEGKLLKPLIAPMIEDLSARLNINAHHNLRLAATTAGLETNDALWAGTRSAFDPATPAASSPNTRDVFRGLGYGPAEIALPEVDLAALVTQRLQSQPGASATNPPPGKDFADQLDVLRTGPRPPIHTAAGGIGYSTDPYGRGGIGLGRSGHLVAAESGRRITADNTATTLKMEAVDESVNDPYESDPTGRLSGDSLFTHDELEAILRSNEFDRDMLPGRLDALLQTLLQSNPEIARALTTISVSDDTPAIMGTDADIPSTFKTFRNRFPLVPDTAVDELIAPELRLGNKIDVNRPFGNGIDDDTDGVIDEPLETETETEAFEVAPSSNQVVPTSFTGQAPDYQFDKTDTGRELLARHLYVLMMTLTNGYSFPVNAGTDPVLYRARRIAQWAVNVVDYRDPDSIMTRFVFDDTPFDAAGWKPPEDLSASPPTFAPAYNITWGVEEPQLVFSEAVAYHDVRVRDSSDDAGDGDVKTTDPMDPKDNDTDQVRIPQGSVFLELYCPRPTIDGDQATKPGVPQELYTTVAGVAELDLGRLAPPAGTATSGVPVWRIAFSERHDAASGNAALSPETQRTSIPDSASFEPEELDELVVGGSSLDLERFIWFRNFATVTEIQNVISDNAVPDMAATEVFFAPTQDVRESKNINVDRFLAPGQFLTIAPREVTRFGSKEVAAAFPGLPSNQRFFVNPSFGLIQFNQASNLLTPTLAAASTAHYTPALPLIIGTFRPSTWPANVFEDGFVGLNVSEPLPSSYYPTPVDIAGDPAFRRYNGTVNSDGVGGVDFPLYDAYLDFSDPATSMAGDQPLDVLNPRVPDDGIEPSLGTIDQYCSAFLQRLADPTLPYDAVTNPYRTVDWISLDLTVFSGEERQDKVDPSDPDYVTGTRQRDGTVGVTQVNALYSYNTSTSATDKVSGGSPDYFTFAGTGHVQSSLSFLNTATTGTDPTDAAQQMLGHCNNGFAGFNPSIGAGGFPDVTGNDRNLPEIPYAIHPWLNRPFVSELELMMVPACSQGRLFEEFSVVPSGADPNVFPTDPADLAVFRAPFRHLLNFFHSDRLPGEAAEFVRLFDFVHTRPPYRGEVDMISPANVTADLLPMLAAPFNLSYDNQRQGRINLNTLAGFPVWKGLMQGHMNTSEFTDPAGAASETQLAFDTFIDNRRGFTPAALNPVTAAGPSYNYDATHLHPLYPTQFASVFRDSMTTPFMPTLEDATATEKLRRRPVNGTLLRGLGILDVNDPEYGATNVGSQFVRDQSENPQWDTSTTPPTNPHLDRNRNPFMRYQTLMRMPNLASDNSQVFLIRMTLGFFEVDANNINSVGAEYNEVIGENQRFQAMFIVDRSIPVGFVPGRDLNARDTVIFERFYQ